jgi:hypothetical protein
VQAIWVPAVFDMSGDELGWIMALGFALIFATASGAVAYYLSRRG